ncbi:MAG: ParA family protein [Leptospiraceae bacterium]|nr:ParA family protein [Leptospiraceae bacterium]
MAIIAIANQKGGVGKTTTAAHLADGLARNGYRTLLVDLDAQGNCTSLFSDPPSREESVHELFRSSTPARDLARKTRNENLTLLPSVLELAEIETLLAGNVDGFFRLREGLQYPEGQSPDFVIMDCPPNLGLLTLNALVAAQYCILPILASRFSLDGIRTMLDTMETVRHRFHQDLKVLGALMTMFNDRTAISGAVLEPVEELVPVFETRISRSVQVEEAHLMRQTLFEYAPSGKITGQYEALIQEVLNGIEKG